MLNKILTITGVVVIAVLLFFGGAWLGMATSSRMNPNVVVGTNIRAVPRLNQGNGLNQPGRGVGHRPGGLSGCGPSGQPGDQSNQDDRNDQDNQDGQRSAGQGQNVPNVPSPAIVVPVPAAPSGGPFANNQPPQGGTAIQMQGGLVPDQSLVPAAGQTLSLENAVKVAQAYVTTFGNANLKLAEVMQFDNHFYARVVEKDTGRGAFEFLIDQHTAAVYPEPGPNMMWNLKYGMMSGQAGMMNGGMMGGINTSDGGATMTVDETEAKSFAQKELDSLVPGAKVESDGVAFYGYYTFDYSVGGKIVGMLGVNGFTGDVVLHAWHGSFVAEQQVK